MILSLQLLLAIVCHIAGSLSVLATFVLLVFLVRSTWRVIWLSRPCNQDQLRSTEAKIRSDMDHGQHFYEEFEARGRRLAEEILERNSAGFQAFPREIDVITHACGFRNQYTCGAWSVLRHLKEHVKVQRWSGGSSGAQSGLLAIADALQPWVTFLFSWRAWRRKTFGPDDGFGLLAVLRIALSGGFPEMWQAMNNVAIMPHRAALYASDMTLHVATMVMPQFKVTLEKLDARSDFNAHMLGTTCIPGLCSGPGVPCEREPYRRLLDPGFLMRKPPAMPPQGRAELEFCLWHLFPGDHWSQFWALWGPSEELQWQLLCKGQDDIAALLEGKTVSPDVMQLHIPKAESKKAA